SDDHGHTWQAVARGPKSFDSSPTGTGRPWINGVTRFRGWWVAWGNASNGLVAIWISQGGSHWQPVLDPSTTTCCVVNIVHGRDRGLLAFAGSSRWSTTAPTRWGQPAPITVIAQSPILAVAPGGDVGVGAPGTIRTSAEPLLRSDDHGLSWRVDTNFANQ